MKRRAPSHDAECEALAYWLRMRSIEFAHIPNEGKRSPMMHKLMIRLGLQPGFPDYLIFSAPREPIDWNNYRGVAIEIKKQDDPPSATRENQKEWQRRLIRCDWRAEICHGADVAIRLLQEMGF